MADTHHAVCHLSLARARARAQRVFNGNGNDLIAKVLRCVQMKPTVKQNT